MPAPISAKDLFSDLPLRANSVKRVGASIAALLPSLWGGGIQHPNQGRCRITQGGAEAGKDAFFVVRNYCLSELLARLSGSLRMRRDGQ